MQDGRLIELSKVGVMVSVRCGIMQFVIVKLDFESSVTVSGLHRTFSPFCVDEDVVVLARQIELVTNLAPAKQSGVDQISTIQYVSEDCWLSRAIRKPEQHVN